MQSICPIGVELVRFKGKVPPFIFFPKTGKLWSFLSKWLNHLVGFTFLGFLFHSKKFIRSGGLHCSQSGFLEGGMLAASRGFWKQQKQPLFFNFRRHLPYLPILIPLMAAASPPRVSSPPYSTASPSHGPAPKRVGTHNGSFHCDEALGCFMIRLSSKFCDADIVRTRDPQVNPLSSTH